jgi:hypothetical protein
MSGTTTPDKTVLRGFGISLSLRRQLFVDPAPKLADLVRGGAFRVKFGHALPCRHRVLMVGSADDRWLGDQPEGRKADACLIDARRSRRALRQDERKWLPESHQALDGRQTAPEVRDGRPARAATGKSDRNMESGRLVRGLFPGPTDGSIPVHNKYRIAPRA